ncbi:MAG: site-2 protease family protein [Clostridiaceae bacterium]|nr:site-2 protease family protein [Clostridiaceae bacterium]MCI9484841.1 site-2 protease family protein [Clostridiaceae bacterium]NBH80338.1 RIP metalloprotease [Clostridiaceae bacterium]
MQTFFTLLLAILGFSVLILVHEAGHCIAAKLCGVQVNEFWLGMGPSLVSKRIGETVYCLKLFPIGGACVMEGEDLLENPGFIPSPRSFPRAKRWKRFVILVAGVAMNFLIGYLIMLVLYFVSNPGISFLRVARAAMLHSVDYAQLVWRSLYELVTGSVGMDQLSGPVGVTGAMMDMVVNYGFKQYAALVAFISVNLGVMNLLPIPGLDGGRILFLLIEAVRRKPMRQEIEGYINAAFMLALFAVIIYATGNDIMRMIAR